MKKFIKEGKMKYNEFISSSSLFINIIYWFLKKKIKEINHNISSNSITYKKNFSLYVKMTFKNKNQKKTKIKIKKKDKKLKWNKIKI